MEETKLKTCLNTSVPFLGGELKRKQMKGSHLQTEPSTDIRRLTPNPITLFGNANFNLKC